MQRHSISISRSRAKGSRLINQFPIFVDAGQHKGVGDAVFSNRQINIATQKRFQIIQQPKMTIKDSGVERRLKNHPEINVARLKVKIITASGRAEDLKPRHTMPVTDRVISFFRRAISERISQASCFT
ncbi:MAG: hypothetical protein OXE84_13085 [Rhodobacteraceae bacterium]|nr:hypothetical protein [Paracoccaceae bacterium]